MKIRFGILIAIIQMMVLLMASCGRYVDVNQKVSIGIATEFSDEYKKANKGQINVEIPEVYEMLNVIIALDNTDEGYSSLTDKESAYYQEVIDRFSAFKDHQAVQQIKKEHEQMSYANIRNLFAYRFDEESNIVPGEYSSQRISAICEQYIEDLEDFAKVSGFRQFYKEHEPFYSDQCRLFESIVPIGQIWSWLEENFPFSHDAVTVVMSPLTGGAHNTFQYRDDDYSEIVMFVSSPKQNSSLSPKVYEGLLSRMLFTEIDHNYVNPTTNLDEHIMHVARAFSDLRKWNTQSGYLKPALTFNEYMTWGTFMLYAGDVYDGEDLEQIRDYTIQMMNNRGFEKFEPFSNQLQLLYDNKTQGQTVADLYPDILNWCSNYG